MYYKKNDRKLKKEEICYMIKEVTTGILGKENSNEGHELKSFTYNNKNIVLEYTKMNYSFSDQSLFQSYVINYYGSLVFQKNNNGVYYNNNGNWLDELIIVYNNHLRKTKEHELSIKEFKEIERKKEKIQEVFKYIYPGNYNDDRIIIDNIEYESIKKSKKDKKVISGTIKTIDGMVLFDFKNNIFYPGAWEEYVCELIETFKEQSINQNCYNNLQLVKRKKK